jgi:demethoxyubiquinone hydroxylase (CLK1/Coq7/Cat5 family)
MAARAEHTIGSVADPQARLVRQLQLAHAGELAAGYAYRGHWRSVRDPEERERIRKIEDEEWHHRRLVAAMLRDLGGRPRPLREAVFWTIGRTLGALCHVVGWFLPMYGAGRLERRNIVEYEDAAVYARASGHLELLDCLLTMAEVEWEHEQYFRARVAGHRLLRLFPLWSAPPPRERIRGNFASEARGEGGPLPEVVRG